MGKASRDKGTRGELEVRDKYRERGFAVNRTPNSGGLSIKADLYGVPGLHVEVKRGERINLQAAIRQAEVDSQPYEIETVHFRRNNEKWYASLSLDDFLTLLQLRLGSVNAIPLRNKNGVIIAWTLVDADDFENFGNQRWCLNNGKYAIGTVKENKRNKTTLLHRAIIGLQNGDPRQVDHINRNTLDNRRSNLRVVTHAENQQNHSARSGSSNYRGVSRHKQTGKWRAYVAIDGFVYNLGYFKTEGEAADVASDFRRLNMPYSEEAYYAQLMEENGGNEGKRDLDEGSV